jgi:hypothetical protein
MVGLGVPKFTPVIPPVPGVHVALAIVPKHHLYGPPTPTSPGIIEKLAEYGSPTVAFSRKVLEI